MLERLTIQNIALIKKQTIEFTNGLNVLTGETGAGKSLIIDSLSGHCVKTFAQYELNKLPELVNELKSNPQSSYITCFNDAIRENNVPQYISVLFKNKNNENERIVREVVGSRILHSLGYPTVYNFALETPGITGLLASVDFISDNQKFKIHIRS